MGFDEILKQIEDERDQRIKQALSAAKAELARIGAETEQKEKALRANARAATKEDTMRTMDREIYFYKTEARRLQREAINATVTEALKELAENIGDFTASPKYPKLLAELASKTKSELGNDIIVQARKEDIDRLKKLLPASATIETTKERLSGGFKATSRDGKRSIDFSIDAISERLQDKLVRRLLDELG